MSEISREEVMEHLKNYNYWIDGGYSWIDDVIRKAISDMERVEVLEKENAELKHKLDKIEQLLNIANNDIRLDNGWDYMFKIDMIVKG